MQAAIGTWRQNSNNVCWLYINSYIVALQHHSGHSPVVVRAYGHCREFYSCSLISNYLYFCILKYNPACIITILFQATSILSLQKERCSSGLLARRPIVRAARQQSVRAAIRLGCLLADLLGNVGATNIKRLLSACRSIVGQRGILQVVCVAGSQHGVRATNFVIRDAGTSS